MLVSPCQKGNPVLGHIRNCPWTYSNILPDYVVGDRCCALYLSVRYHQLHTAKYLHSRIARIGRLYDLRLIMLHVDVPSNSLSLADSIIEEVTRIATLNSFTVICVWSHAEVARWLEALKLFEPRTSGSMGAPQPASGFFSAKGSSSAASVSRPPREGSLRYIDAGIAGVISNSSSSSSSSSSVLLDRVAQILLLIPTVNRTDCLSLLRHFGSLRGIILASEEELQQVKGIGPKKARHIYDAFHEPIQRPFLHTRPLAAAQLPEAPRPPLRRPDVSPGQEPKPGSKDFDGEIDDSALLELELE